jgi:superfamily II helicase
MRLWNRIQAEARELAGRAGARIAAIEHELYELEARRMSLENEREALGLASSRLSGFNVSLGTNYLCPYCWMEHQKIALMLLVSVEQDQQIVRCRECEHELAA